MLLLSGSHSPRDTVTFFLAVSPALFFDFSVLMSLSPVVLPFLASVPYVEPISQMSIFSFLLLLHILSPWEVLFPSFNLVAWTHTHFYIGDENHAYIFHTLCILTICIINVCGSTMNPSHLSTNDLSSLHHLSLFLALFSVWNYWHITYWQYDLNILKTSLLSLLLVSINPSNSVGSVFRRPIISVPPRFIHTPSLKVQTSSISYLNYLSNLAVF